jgi:hypothetical protein
MSSHDASLGELLRRLACNTILPPSHMHHFRPQPSLQQIQATIHRLLDKWEADGWVDPWSGEVTSAGSLPVCGTLGRVRGYARTAHATYAAAAHRWGWSGWFLMLQPAGKVMQQPLRATTVAHADHQGHNCISMAGIMLP